MGRESEQTFFQGRQADGQQAHAKMLSITIQENVIPHIRRPQIISIEKRKLLYYWWECKLVQPLWKNIQIFLKLLKIELPYDPAIQLLSIYMKKIKTLTRIQMFIAALSIIAKTWE